MNQHRLSGWLGVMGALALATAAGCVADGETTGGGGDDGAGSGDGGGGGGPADDPRAQYGEPCTDISECASGICIESANDPAIGTCTHACTEGCAGAECVDVGLSFLVCDPPPAGGGGGGGGGSSEPMPGADCSCTDHPMTNHACTTNATIAACGSTELKCFEYAPLDQPAGDGFCTQTCTAAQENQPCSLAGTCTRVGNPNLGVDWFICE